MSTNSAPWGTSEDGPAALLDGLRLHWPHYTHAELSIVASWDFEQDVFFPNVYEGDPPIIECEEQTRTDTWTASASGSLSWDRQAPEDECYGATPAAGELYGFLTQTGASVTPPTPSVPSVLAHSFRLASSATNVSGTISQTIHTGDACDITVTTPTGTFELTASPGTLGILEDGLGRWFKFHDTDGGGPMVDIATTTGPGLPSALPTITTFTPADIGGPPSGAPIVISRSLTLTVPDTGGFHGTATLSLTLTLTAP